MTIEVAILGKPTPAQREAFRKAKANLGITEPMLFVGAKPGCGRLIAFGHGEELPPFAAEWMTLYGAEEKNVTDVLGWYCKLRRDPRVSGVRLWLERTLGVAVTEVA